MNQLSQDVRDALLEVDIFIIRHICKPAGSGILSTVQALHAIPVSSKAKRYFDLNKNRYGICKLINHPKYEHAYGISEDTLVVFAQAGYRVRELDPAKS